MILPGTYANGFAPRDGQPLYPELWRGCVGAWAPCLGPTGLTLRDWSGYGNHGTLTAMTAGDDWVVDQGQYALDLDGMNDHVVVPQIPNQTNGTYSAWVKYAGGNTPVFGTSGTTTSYIMLFWTFTNTIFVGDATAVTQVSWPFVASEWLSRWRHIAVVKRGSTLEMFFDGISQGTHTQTNISPVTFLGRGQSPYWSGMLDSLGIWNRALSQKEIRLLASRRGIAYDLAPRRRSRIFTGGFKAYWAARKALIQMAGSN